MTGVALNFDATNVQVEAERTFEPLPAGWYNCTVTHTERKPSKANPQNSYLEIVYTVMDGKYANRKLFHRLNLWNQDATASEIAFKGASGLASLQQAVGVFNCQTTAQLHGIPLKAKVRVRPPSKGKDGQEYGASNEITKHASINADVGEDSSGAGVPGAAGGGTPPWAAAGPAPEAAPAGFPPAPAQAPPAAAAAPAPATQPWEQPAAAPSAAPAPQEAAPAPAAAGAPPWVADAQAAAPAPAPEAAPAPTAPPPEAVPAGPVMLAAAEGVPYEEYRKAGWTDEQLIAHGKMAAPAAPAAPSAQPTPAAAPAGAQPPWATT